MSNPIKKEQTEFHTLLPWLDKFREITKLIADIEFQFKEGDPIRSSLYSTRIQLCQTENNVRNRVKSMFNRKDWCCDKTPVYLQKDKYPYSLFDQNGQWHSYMKSKEEGIEIANQMNRDD